METYNSVKIVVLDDAYSVTFIPAGKDARSKVTVNYSFANNSLISNLTAVRKQELAKHIQNELINSPINVIFPTSV